MTPRTPGFRVARWLAFAAIGLPLAAISSPAAATDEEIAGCLIPEQAFEFLRDHTFLYYDVRRRLMPNTAVMGDLDFVDWLEVEASLMRDQAKIYGYALGQQARYVPPPRDGRPSAEKACWDLMDRGLRQFLLADHHKNCTINRTHLYTLVKNGGPGLSLDADEALERHCSQNFARELQALAGNAMTGAYDAELVAWTGVAPNTAPSIFGRNYDPEALAEVAEVTRIGADDLKATPLGAEIAEMNEVLRDLRENGEKLAEGSYERQVLAERFNALLAERDRRGEPLRGIRDTEVRLYGARAKAEAPAIRAAVVRYPIDRRNLRGLPLHAWFNRQHNLEIAEAQPRFRDLEDATSSASSQ